MDTTERFMIMGMCLQGLLANPNVFDGGFTSDRDPEVAKRGEDYAEQQRAYVVKEAHRIADLLDPPATVTAAQEIAGLTRVCYEAIRVCYEAIRAAHAEEAGWWKPYSVARGSVLEADADRVDGVFERVSRWYRDPTGLPETTQDRIIAAIVAASKGAHEL